MTSLVEVSQRSTARSTVPTALIAGVAWPYDKLAMVVATLSAVVLVLVTTSSPQLASWIGAMVGAAAFVTVRALSNRLTPAPSSGSRR